VDALQASRRTAGESTHNPSDSRTKQGEIGAESNEVQPAHHEHVVGVGPSNMDVLCSRPVVGEFHRCAHSRKVIDHMAEADAPSRCQTRKGRYKSGKKEEKNIQMDRNNLATT
jgi:hypothetical protein